MFRYPRLLTLSCCVAVAAACLLPVSQAHAMNAQEQAPYRPLQLLLDGLAKRDQQMMRDQALPSFHATLMREGKPLELDLDAFLARLPKTGTEKLLEQIHNPEIRIDDNVAVIWAPYTFFIDDKVHHCGSNVVTLVRIDGNWRISSVADTARTSCPKG